MKKKICDLFDIWQGDQITDETIYKRHYTGTYPIFTGHNTIKGYTNKPRINNIPCITIPSKGIINKLYLQNTPFDANNTIALMPLKNNEIDLEYLIYTKTNYIVSFISSKNTNNYLNNNILKNIELNYPDFKTQINIRNEYKLLIKMKNKIYDNIQKIETKFQTVVHVDGDEKLLNDVFILTVGSDDSLTEKYAYDNVGKYPLYSGKTSNLGIYAHIDRWDYDPKYEYLTWTILGNAGTLYLREGKCCLTRHCGIMIPKNQNNINLKWFIITQQKKLQDYAIGQNTLGQLKKIYIKTYKFILPKIEVQNEIVKEYEKLKKINEHFYNINLKLKNRINIVVT